MREQLPHPQARDTNALSQPSTIWPCALSVAFACSLALSTSLATEARAAGLDHDASAWQLTQPITHENRDPRGVQNGSVLLDEIGATSGGGFIRVTLKGSGPNGPCPGHAQRFRLTWRFDRDATRFGGKPGNIILGTTATLEGDKDDCLDAKPFWKLEEEGALLGTTPGGWGSHYFKDPPNTLPGKMTLSIRVPNRTHEGFHIQFAAGWPWPMDFRVLYLYDALPGGAGPVLPPATSIYTVTGQTSQGEVRDATGRVTVESSTIRQVQCYIRDMPGRAVLIYEYPARHAFRAIEPPNWGSPIGGHEFATFDAAADAACGLHR